MKRRGLLVTMLVAVALSSACGRLALAGERQDLNGAGATFPVAIYSRWFADYAKLDPSVSFSYKATGSSEGQRAILEGSVDFGASDGPMNNKSLAKAPSKILHIPTVAGAVVLTYNLPGVQGLKLDGPVIADIYLGRITRWNDPAIVNINDGLKLPDTDITVVHRSDGSGTSYIFTDYLSAVSSFWELKVGKFTLPSWPVGLGGKGNDGVMEVARHAAGSIGYVELAYALQNQVAMAAIRNSDGEYVLPSVESVTAAMRTAIIPDDFRFSMVDPPGKASYPISGATWLLVYQQQRNPDKGKALVAFLKWAVTVGQNDAPALGYAPLTDEVRKRVLDLIGTIGL